MTSSTEALLQGNGTAITIEKYWCVYPISGQYTRMQRILFYVAILLAFFTRFHHWLSSGALMFVVLYTLTTATHAIPPSLQPHVGCDSDSFAVTSVLGTAYNCSCMAVIFSPKIFHVRLQPLYRVWLLFLVIVSNLSSYSLLRFVDSSAQYRLNVLVTAETAPLDPCSIFEPDVLFRGGPNDGLNSILVDRFTTQNYTYFPNNSTYEAVLPSNYHLDDARDNMLIEYLLFTPLLALEQYNEKRRPRESRRTAFRYLIPISLVFEAILAYFMGDRLYKRPWHHRHSDIRHLHSSVDIERAKYMAFLWYLTCLLAYLAWPVVMLWTIIHNEKLLFSKLPESEGPAAIGQWGHLRTWWRNPGERAIADNGTAVTRGQETISLRTRAQILYIPVCLAAQPAYNYSPARQSLPNETSYLPKLSQPFPIFLTPSNKRKRVIMEVALTFGSVGDIIAICQIAAQLRRALDVSSGSAKEYQDLRSDLDKFTCVLMQLESCPSLGNLAAQRKSIVNECATPINDALDRWHPKYHQSLQPGGSGNAVKDAFRKVEWSVREKQALQELQDKLRKNTERLALLTGITSR
ncbi:hypothetical protein PG994_002947 [Apiospora phragmitis]|uniref:Uncharacterized protein n=1 Tax=Apiospora phragmitis TaxID=2905665 RepID=A0ABR1W6M6_9PEZI